MNTEQTIAQAIRVGNELQDPAYYYKQDILVKRLLRLMRSLTIRQNLQVRRGMGFPIDCHGNDCGKCDECWYRQLAVNMLESQGVDTKSTTGAAQFILQVAIGTIKDNLDEGLQ